MGQISHKPNKRGFGKVESHCKNFVIFPKTLRRQTHVIVTEKKGNFLSIKLVSKSLNTSLSDEYVINKSVMQKHFICLSNLVNILPMCSVFILTLKLTMA